MKLRGWGRLVAAIPLLAIVFLMSGCSTDMGVLDPKGIVADQQFDLIMITIVISIIILVPVLGMAFYFAWKYREANKANVEYKPNWSHSTKIEAWMWGIPILIIVVLGAITVAYSYKLEPSKALAAESEQGVKPITIEVTSLDWKWLFTYPEQGIATVNYVRFPEDVPVEFKLTSDAPMNSFWIPQLGGQIYTMSGMAMELNLMASEIGQYQGRGANFSGEHFGKMEFIAEATSQGDFDKWVSDIKQSSPALTEQGYDELAEPGIVETNDTYSSFPEGLFDRIVSKYGSSHNHSEGSEGETSSEATSSESGADK
ncbi:ubiquinol oxidase subunit II [Cohnella thailandensis]|uniref:Quinol oxidase subunit 2 n=1 Tax=Cohnella thailandensis TaxID=557557 RepID=A0A841ST91_9BACL|nr:ubiquinol oxidase subunit II [Cohnella thailandensis]MBB6634442.1 ubiquinol oxidase subunit II [Cohnella thailandensis]MBP1972058.1 cytochrome o ubiquinol oxidase subunit 2 [Cohnella thailandensis]